MLTRGFFLLLGAIFLAAACGGDSNGSGGSGIEPLDPQSVYDGQCDYLSAETLNTVFDSVAAESNINEPTTRTDLWRFDNPGVWSEAARSCFWNSTNTEGVSITLLGKAIPEGTDFGNPNEDSYFIKDVDPFALVIGGGSRLEGFPRTDEAAYLGSSNYGEGGIAFRRGHFAMHVHVNINNEPDLDIQLHTVRQTELALTRHLLLRIEEFES